MSWNERPGYGEARSGWPTGRFWLAFWLSLFLFSIYLLSFSGKFHVMDELAVFTAGHNLARYGRADIDQLIWTNHWTPNPPGVWGQDGHLYTKKAPGISFLAAPLIWLGHALPGLNAVHVGLLANTLVTALTAGLLFWWLLDLDFSRATALLTGLGYGLGTIAWVYARMFWESSMLALCFLGAVWAVYRAAELPPAAFRLRPVFLAGLAMAAGLTLRFETVPALIFIGLYLGIKWWLVEARRPALAAVFPAHLFALLRFSLAYLSLPLLFSLGLLFFNLIRYGSFSETGYTQELLFRAPWVGGLGLLASPGRGLFIYAPLTLLLFFGLGPAWRRLPRLYLGLIAVLCLFYWLFYGAWFAWGGTWGWGPRFLLPILPLLMVFVAGAIEAAKAQLRDQAGPLLSSLLRSPAWLGIGVLAGLSLLVNFLGLAVDFNEHFLRLGSNDNFVFNWAAFPPLAHWRILQEGLVDIIWLQPTAAGLRVAWPVLAPALILFGLAAPGLIWAIRGWIPSPNVATEGTRSRAGDGGRANTVFHSRWLASGLAALFLLLTFFLTYQVMRATARLDLASAQAQADLPLLETLAGAARPGDWLLVPMPPFGDVQEISTRLMAYLDPPLPTLAWIESGPRSIDPGEREQLWQTIQSQAGQVWLFERWLTQQDSPSLTRTRLEQEAFPVQEQWFAYSGRLTRYGLARKDDLPAPVPLHVPFQGGLSVVNFTLLDKVMNPGEILRLRLTWQAGPLDQEAAPGLPPEGVSVFVQLLAAGGQTVAQHDRLLLDLQNFKQSPLLPGQTVFQGYGLLLPDDLPSGSYPLVIGLYRTADGQRLFRTDDSPDDFLYLTDVMVK